MKKIILLLILIISSFTLTACSQSTDLESENFFVTFQSDISSEETLSSEELPSNDTEWQDKIDVLFEQIEDNILGYSLIRTAQELSYIRDADYLIEEDAVGNGIFVSEHMAETEAFLGQLLMDALDRRGEIAQENRTYFTDWAAQQLAETNWKLLDQEWTPNKYAYDRFYTLSHIWGDVGYEFTYTIYADNASMTKPETQAAQVKLSVDDNGMICGINVDIYFEDQEHSGVFHTENTTMLYYDEYPEQIVDEGVQLACGDTAADAEQFGELVINALESRGEDDNLFEIVQSVGSLARYVFYYDAQTCKISDVFFNPILIANQYIAYIENGELIIRDIFDEETFCKKIARDFTETADPTSAIISITLEKEGQFVIEYCQGEDYKMETEIISE